MEGLVTKKSRGSFFKGEVRVMANESQKQPDAQASAQAAAELVALAATGVADALARVALVLLAQQAQRPGVFGASYDMAAKQAANSGAQIRLESCGEAVNRLNESLGLTPSTPSVIATKL